MNYFINLWEKARKNLVFPWVIVFLIINVAVTERGGTNAAARFATLRAIVDNHTFEITPYKDWTADWAQTPDGKYYSNKLPGPIFVGLPLFILVDGVAKIFEKNNNDEGIRPPPGYYHKMLLSFFLQVLPFALLVMAFVHYYQKKNKNLKSLHFLALALLMGNTSSFFMNSYFGHGMAALWLVAFYFAFEKKKYYWMGFFLGMAILTDFAACVFAPFFGLFVLYKEKKINKNVLLVLLGGIIPGILWSFYHISCYGSPFLTSNSFPNPEFENLYLEGGETGLFYFFPRISVIYELIVGGSRGILFTVPWLFFLMIYSIAIFLVKKIREKIPRELKEEVVFINLSFWALILVNACFGGWHAGSSPGPRYLAALMPFWAFLAVKFYPYFSKVEKRILWIGLILSLLFRGQVLATTILAPLNFLWVWQWEQILSHGSLTPWIRLILFWGGLAIAFKKVKKTLKPL